MELEDELEPDEEFQFDSNENDLNELSVVLGAKLKEDAQTWTDRKTVTIPLVVFTSENE